MEFHVCVDSWPAHVINIVPSVQYLSAVNRVTPDAIVPSRAIAEPIAAHSLGVSGLKSS